MQNKVEKIFEFMRVLDKVCLVKRAKNTEKKAIVAELGRLFFAVLENDSINMALTNMKKIGVSI